MALQLELYSPIIFVSVVVKYETGKMTKSLRYVLISFCKDVVKIKSLLHIIPDLFLTYFCKHR